MSGKGLAATLDRILSSVGETAAAMPGQHNGVQKIVKDKYPTATYVRGISHCMNLCLEEAAMVVEVTTC